MRSDSSRFSENGIIRRWDQSKVNPIVSVPLFFKRQTVKKKKSLVAFPLVLLLWSIPTRRSGRQTFKSAERAHSKKPLQAFTQLIKLSKAESISRDRGSIFTPVFPVACRPKSPSCPPVPSDSLTFPPLLFLLPLSPFKQDSNSSTQLFSTLLLLLLLRLLLPLPPFLRGCEKPCGMLIVLTQSPIRFLITQRSPEVVNGPVNYPFPA